MIPANDQANATMPADSTASASELQRHPEIWFDDGNIVVIADGTAFCVYCGLLAAQSTIFCDTFASSTPIPDEAFDGCPVVELSDSPHDLAHLLRVLLPKEKINFRSTTEDTAHTFDEVAAVIRLAHKYDIPQVLNQALATLQAHTFPTSFAAFSAPSGTPEIDLKPAHFIGVVNFAWLTDTPHMLPLALYRCCYLIDGWTHEDGTVEHLCPANLKRCMDARVALESERSFFLFHLLVHGKPSSAACDCPCRAECSASLRQLYECTMHVDSLAHLCELRGRTEFSQLFRHARPPAALLMPSMGLGCRAPGSERSEGRPVWGVRSGLAWEEREGAAEDV
ncbi:hypothetical protein GSI_12253 [Ganoderma sinense ZZ0214-1]|uniref:BTB domain-containing protein n=1 Tax=Ganoderma sinense ZZ0214-1 TaxID=1077348 RepID=A0A2G8RYB2_9APHY|nr:hypothetical protein GSI_12253 [Ganoderma sinense ZZ0214-1]